MIDKKIYSPWAYTVNEDEKQKINMEIYNELLSKYKVSKNKKTYNMQKRCWEEINPDDYDVIVDFSHNGYAHTVYHVIKNAPNLSYDELALICDSGNLCFGYDLRGGICIFTD